VQCWKIAVCQSNLFRKRCSELLQFLVCGGCKLSNTWIQFLYLSWSHRYVKISLQQNAKKIKLNNMDTSISLCIPLSGNYDRPAYNVQQIKLTDVSFWVHVKIASRITSYRKVGLFLQVIKRSLQGASSLSIFHAATNQNNAQRSFCQLGTPHSAAAPFLWLRLEHGTTIRQRSEPHRCYWCSTNNERHSFRSPHFTDLIMTSFSELNWLCNAPLQHC